MVLTTEIIAKEIFPIFEKNGFKMHGNDIFNKKCVITVYDDCYKVHNLEQEDSWWSNDPLIYALIGYLTYHGLMDKNYIQ